MFSYFCYFLLFYTSISDNILLHNETQTAYIILLHDAFIVYKTVEDMMFLCVNIYWYTVTCIIMVITCQTPEFGRATTVLGITMLGKLLTG